MPTLRSLRHLRPAVAARVAGALVILGTLVFAGQASFGSHTVVQGDTLWAIARANGITVSQLAAANGLNPNGILRIGTELTIPEPGSTAVTASVTRGGAAVGGFCAGFEVPGGVEALPAALSADPERLALRPLFVEWADDYGVSPALVEAVAWQESGWQQGVVSSAQAVGVGQLLPSTAQFVSQDLVGQNLDIDAISDNIRMSAAYLAYLQRNLGSTCATIAGYYEGLRNMEHYGVLSQSVPYVRSVAALLPQFTV